MPKSICKVVVQIKFLTEFNPVAPYYCRFITLSDIVSYAIVFHCGLFISLTADVLENFSYIYWSFGFSLSRFFLEEFGPLCSPSPLSRRENTFSVMEQVSINSGCVSGLSNPFYIFLFLYQRFSVLINIV